MNQLSVAVCDEDDSYGRKLVEYLMQKGRLTEAAGYYDRENLIQRLKEDGKEIWLVHSAILGSKEFSEERRNNKEQRMVCLAEDEVDTDLAELPRIYKYQSADCILRKLYQIAGRGSEEGTQRAKCRGRTIGLISPWYSGISLLCGIALAERYAAEGKVLYINTVGYHGLSLGGMEESGPDISDVIFAVKMDAHNIEAKIMSGVVPLKNAFCLLPAQEARQIADICKADYEQLLACIWDKLHYDCVVLELQAGCMELEEISLLCDEVYCFEADNFAEGAVTERLRRMDCGVPVRIEKVPEELLSYCRSRREEDAVTAAECMADWMRQITEGETACDNG